MSQFRRSLSRVVAPAICALILGLGAGPADAAAFRVILGTSPNQPQGDISITLPPSATTTSIPVFLKNDGRKTVRNLRIYATATHVAVRAPKPDTGSTSGCDGSADDEPSSLAPGERVSESGVTISFPIADASGRLAIPSKAEITGTLRVEGLTTPGTYVAEVHAEKDSKHQQLLARVKIVKRAALEFSLEGAGSTGLQAIARTSAFEGNYDLISGSALPSEVTIELGGISGPDNEQIDPVLLVGGVPLSAPICIAPFGRATLNMKVATPLTGDYLSSLQVVAADPKGGSDRLTIAVKINRIRPTTSIQSEGGLVSPVEMWLAADADVSINFRETEGRDVHLSTPPSLYIYRAKDAAKYSAGVQLRAIDGVPIPSAQPTAETSPSPGALAEPAQSIVVPAHTSKTLVATLGSIPEPGQYHGNLRFDVVDGTSVIQEFTVVARRTWLLAAALIVAGLLLGELVRQFVNRRLPRLQLRSKIETLAGRITVLLQRPSLPEVPTADLHEMQGRLASAAHVTLTDDWESAKDAVAAVQAQLDAFPAWIEIQRLLPNRLPDQPLRVRIAALTTAMHQGTLRDVDKAALANATDVRTALGDAPRPARDAIDEDLPPAAPQAPRSRFGLSVGTQLKLTRLVVWTVLVIAATLIGLQALWATNATWGTFPDFAAALLWGLGAWAAVGSPFGGTNTLLKTITASTT